MDQRLVDELSASGHLTPDWLPSFFAVPREKFIPDTIWRQVETRSGPDLVPLRRDEHPDLWLELASGDDGVSFMRLRDQRIAPRYQEFSYTDDENEQAGVTETDIYPAEVASGDYALGAIIAIGTQVNDCRMGYFPSKDPVSHNGILWLADHDSGSWTRLYYDHDAGAPYTVRQYGPRRLWDEVAAAYSWWVDQGRPEADCWRFTVTPDGQRIELISP